MKAWPKTMGGVLRVWRVSRSLHVGDHFVDLEKKVSALYSLQKDNFVVPTQHYMLV